LELTAGSAADSPWAALGGSEFARKDDALGERWKDVGPWLVVVLLPLVALGFRRGLLFALPLLLVPGLLISTEARAGFWDDLWTTRDQQAQAALRQQRAADAVALAKDPAIAAEAYYRTGDFVNAGQSWAQQNQADSHYNYANSLAQLGQFDAAIAEYDAALALDPEMEDAVFNRDLVGQMKQQQEQQEQQEQKDREGESDEEQSGDESEQGEQGDEQSSEDQQEGQQGEEESGEQKEGEESDRPSDAEMQQNWSEEDAQAMEQWLRRIPDDPGGLLRRKFRNEHERRGSPADEIETW
jgi:Ca-activated chloride channel family protein